MELDQCGHQVVANDDDDDDDETSECASGSDSEEEEEDKGEVEVIDNNVMREVMRVYYEDVGHVGICRDRMRDAFGVRGHIAWWYRDTVELKRGEHPLNAPGYRLALFDMLWRALDYVRLFGFVGFFFVRDMKRWTAQHSQSVDDYALPFELIELTESSDRPQPGCFVRRRAPYSLQRQLLYRCQKQWIAKQYDVYIYQRDPVFRPLTDKELEYCDDGDGRLAPVSPFFHLYTKKEAVLEAELAAGDANNFACRPEPFLQTKLLPDGELEDVPEPLRYDADNLTDLLHSETTRRVNTTTRQADSYIRNTLNHKSRRAQEAEEEARRQFDAFMNDSDDEGGGAPDSAYGRRLEFFDRPSLKSMLRALPANTSLARGPQPRILLNPVEMRREYEGVVCNLMGVPHLYFNPYTHTGSRSSLTPAHVKFSQERMADSLARIEVIFSALFYELYKRTYGVSDTALFAAFDKAQDAPLSRDIAARLKFPPPEKPNKKQKTESPPTPAPPTTAENPPEPAPTDTKEKEEAKADEPVAAAAAAEKEVK